MATNKQSLKNEKKLLQEILKDVPKDKAYVMSPKTYAYLYKDLDIPNGKTKITINVSKMPKGKKLVIL